MQCTNQSEAKLPNTAHKKYTRTGLPRRSQRAAVSGMKLAVSMIASAEIGSRGRLHDAHGVLTSERVREAVQIELLKRNCSGRDIIVAGGDQATDPHERGSGAFGRRSYYLGYFSA